MDHNGVVSFFFGIKNCFEGKVGPKRRRKMSFSGTFSIDVKVRGLGEKHRENIREKSPKTVGCRVVSTRIVPVVSGRPRFNLRVMSRMNWIIVVKCVNY